MAFNPLLEAEPYEESQVGSPRSGLSSLPEAEALRQFYEDQERRDMLERKLSKKNSARSPRRTRLSVKRTSSEKRRDGEGRPLPQQQHQQQYHQQPTQMPQAQQSRTTLMGSRESLLEKSDSVPPLLRSIIPDPLNELPPWYPKEQLVSPANPILFKQRYPIHNPIGPRYYRNHHLTAPKGVVRPSSFFSPSFPPMASFHTRSQDSGAQLSTRTPSGSPLPTPQSSQTGIADFGRRSRKNSQNAPDNVDLLDVTDPTGKNWHHTSPYDLNISNGSSSPEVLDPPRTRLTSSATTRAPRANKVPTPSPLSQSTSALHLNYNTDDGKVTRKLSKRRTPVFGSFFSAPKQPKPRTASLPTSPVNPTDPVRVALHDPPAATVNGKRSSTLPVSASAVDLPSKSKDRRGSMLGRLVKKFSILRKPAHQHQERAASVNGHWHHVSSDDVRSPHRRSLNEQPSGLISPKRVPPPAVQDTAPTPEPDRRSSVSVEMPARGPLTIANPDIPSPHGSNNSDTPTQRPITLESGILEQINFTDEPKNMKTAPAASSAPTRPASSSLAKRTTSPAQQRPKSISPPPTDPMPKRSSRSTVRSSQTTVRSSAHSLSAEQESTPRPRNAHLRPSVDRSLPPTPMLDESRPLSTASTIGTRPFSMSSTVANPPTSLAYYQESPLSTSSMIANPPTPFGATATMPPSSPEPLPTRGVPVTNGVSSHKISTVTGKETETFRLVRSDSGHVDVNGEQWEVVEAPQLPKPEKEKTKSGEKDRSRSNEKEKDRAPNKLSKSKSEVRPPSQINHYTTSASQRLNGRESPRKSERRSEERHSRRESSTTSLQSGEQVRMNGGAHVERRPSQASRPMSEMPSAAEMNGVRAREAYDLERLWKAQTMYNSDHAGPGKRYVPSDSSSPMPDSMRTIHGSSHTSFSISSPFTPNANLPHAPSHYTPHSQRASLQSFPPSRSSGPPMPVRIMNKLPAPPQESPYQSPLLTDSKWLATTAH